MTLVVGADKKTGTDTPLPEFNRVPKHLLKMVKGLTPVQRAKLLSLATPRLVEPYMVHIPHPKQQVFLSIIEREAMFGGAAGGGKLLPLSSNVLTPKGWRRNGDLVVGDVVVDPRTGGTTTVVLAHPVQHVRAWRVYFDDGTSLDCGEEHLWTVKRAGKRNKKHNRTRSLGHDDKWLGGYEVVTTATLRDWANSAKSARSRGVRPNAPMIPVNRAVEFTRPYRNINFTLPVDPYLLGLMIGDGHMPSLQITTADQDTVEWLEKWALENNASIGHDRRYGYRIAYAPELRKGLKTLGLGICRSWEKFIPKDYLFAPLEWRTKLMQGLMDTDGYVDARGHMSYTTVSKQLAEDVATLARSMGAFAKVTTKIPTYMHDGVKKVGRKAYTIWIKGHQPESFVSLPRKKVRAIQQQNQPVRRVVRVVRLLQKVDMRCITVGTTDGLYIASENYTVTHNSDSLLMAALQYVDVPGYSALILRRTWPDLNSPGAILDRARSWLSNTDVQIKDGGRIMVFPSGARIQFGYLAIDKDKFKFQCFTPNHEVLTARGWVPVKEVTTDDVVASVNPDSRVMTYEKVSRTFAYDYAGDMVDVYQQNGVSFKVTPNHTIWSGTEKDRRLRPVHADKLPMTTTIPQIFTWEHEEAVGKHFGVRGGQRNGHTFTPEQWLKFLGWYVSEGNSGSYNGRWEVNISQKKESGTKQLRSDLSAVEGTLHWSDDGLSLNNKALVEWLEENTGGRGAHNKRLPDEVWDLDAKWAEILLEALVAGDGSVHTSTWWRYHTYSPQLSDDIMRLAVHAGWRPTLDVRKGGDYKDDSVMFIVHLSKRNRDTGLQTAKKQTPSSWWKNTPYEGKVYCVETNPHHSLVIRHRGRVSLSGNSAEYQFIGFDELTQFQESAYTYMFSRIRRPQLSCLTCGIAVRKYLGTWSHAREKQTRRCNDLFPDPKVVQQYPPAKDGMSVFDVPLRMRSATNPGGVGHEWVRSRFVDSKTRTPKAVFVPAKLSDNPSLDQESYRENLEHLTPADRERLMNGDWDITEEGEMFQRHWFRILEGTPTLTKKVRFWDKAATEGAGDYTVGSLVGLTDSGQWYIEDIVRGQWSSMQTERIMQQTAAADGVDTPIRIEQEPGSSGKDVVDQYARNVLVGYDFGGIRSTGDKSKRAYPLASAAEAGNVFIKPGLWNKKFIDELSMFPQGNNDDQVDATAHAVNFLSFARRSRLLV